MLSLFITIILLVMITKYSDLRMWDYGGTMKVRDRYTVRRKIENDDEK